MSESHDPLTEKLRAGATFQRVLSVGLQELLFGAIALNLVVIMWWAIVIGGASVLGFLYSLFEHHLHGITTFVLAAIGTAVVSQVAQFCLWGARGFTEIKPFRIIVVGCVFIIYGTTGAKSGLVDGYVALGVTAVTLLVILTANWRKFGTSGELK